MLSNHLHDYLNIYEMKKQMHCKMTMNTRNDAGKVQKEA